MPTSFRSRPPVARGWAAEGEARRGLRPLCWGRGPPTTQSSLTGAWGSSPRRTPTTPPAATPRHSVGAGLKPALLIRRSREACPRESGEREPRRTYPHSQQAARRTRMGGGRGSAEGAEPPLPGAWGYPPPPQKNHLYPGRGSDAGRRVGLPRKGVCTSRFLPSRERQRRDEGTARRISGVRMWGFLRPAMTGTGFAETTERGGNLDAHTPIRGRPLVARGWAAEGGAQKGLHPLCRGRGGATLGAGWAAVEGRMHVAVPASAGTTDGGAGTFAPPTRLCPAALCAVGLRWKLRWGRLGGEQPEIADAPSPPGCPRPCGAPPPSRTPGRRPRCGRG